MAGPQSQASFPSPPNLTGSLRVGVNAAWATIRVPVEALVRFKRKFNRDLTPPVLAELYLAGEA